MIKYPKPILFCLIFVFAFGVSLSVAFADTQCPFSSGTCVQLSPSSVSDSTSAITVAGTGSSSNLIYFYLLDPQGNVIKPADVFPAARSQTYSFIDLGFPANLPIPGTYTVFAGSTSSPPPPLTDFNSLKNWFGSSGDYGYHSFDSIVSLPVPAILHVIKLVVNGNGGTAVPSSFNVHVKNAGTDVLGSPASGIAVPGTSYSLSAGTYTVSEDANASYVQTFTGDCDSSGNITLAPSDNKICTVVNTDIPAPAPVVTPQAPSASPASSGGGSTDFVALIGILKVPSPLSLPGGAGSVTYNYTVWNPGQPPLINVTLTDDTCSPVAFLSGDLNSNGRLDPGENWKYSCTTNLSKTTVNTTVATGHTDSAVYFSQTAIATAVATVVVTPLPGLPNTGLVPPLINIVNMPSRLTAFPYGGGNVTYAYTITNPGVISMHDVAVSDDKCSAVSRISGDGNNNNLLDPGETWTYTCSVNVPISTRNVATAKGQANGFTALGYAFSTVLVSAPSGPTPVTSSPIVFSPTLPNTGTASVSGEQVKTIITNLGSGNSGSDVTILQQFLISQNNGPASRALANVGPTAYFGALTRAALAEFQAKVGISPALGNFGPITRAYLSAH